MTHHKDPITTAARLLREAADEYADGIRINGEPDWANEPETHAAYLENMEAAQALDDLADSLGAGGVSPLRHQIAAPNPTPCDAVRAFREFLAVHPVLELSGQAMDDAALELARIALDFPAPSPQCLHQIAEPALPWQPIATAPRDGTRILLATRTGRIADGDFHRGVWVWPYVMTEPTHWMPMPTPPSTPGVSDG